VEVIKSAADLMLEFVEKGNPKNAAEYYKKIKEEEHKGMNFPIGFLMNSIQPHHSFRPRRHSPFGKYNGRYYRLYQ
jgi:hypothetical protein